MPRRSLDDDIYGDRQDVRSHRSLGGTSITTFDFAGSGGSRGGASSKWLSGSRCYEKHPPLVLPGDAKLTIFGGSCSTPVVTDADIYIGFDWSMKRTSRAWPWKKGTEFLFEIRDMDAPSNPDEFKKLVAWTVKQLEAGAKIHAGCIGGHGRTGTFLAALVAVMGEKDAVTYVRTHYCHKAVESGVQVDFLANHFGVTPVSGHKQHSGKYSGAPSTTKTTGGKRSKVGGTRATNTVRVDPLPLGNRDRIW